MSQFFFSQLYFSKKLWLHLKKSFPTTSTIPIEFYGLEKLNLPQCGCQCWNDHRSTKKPSVMDTNHRRCTKNSCCGPNKTVPLPRLPSPPTMDALKKIKIHLKIGHGGYLNSDIQKILFKHTKAHDWAARISKLLWPVLAGSIGVLWGYLRSR